MRFRAQSKKKKNGRQRKIFQKLEEVPASFSVWWKFATFFREVFKTKMDGKQLLPDGDRFLTDMADHSFT